MSETWSTSASGFRRKRIEVDSPTVVDQAPQAPTPLGGKDRVPSATSPPWNFEAPLSKFSEKIVRPGLGTAGAGEWSDDRPGVAIRLPDFGTPWVGPMYAVASTMSSNQTSSTRSVAVSLLWRAAWSV